MSEFETKLLEIIRDGFAALANEIKKYREMTEILEGFSFRDLPPKDERKM